MSVTDQHLIAEAQKFVGKRVLSSSDAKAAGVACALLTEKGNVYMGVNIDAKCGVGFCAEYSAIANMVTHGENTISSIVTINHKGTILPPCGRCRELMHQISDDNLQTRVILEGKVMRLEALLPELWTTLYPQSQNGVKTS